VNVSAARRSIAVRSSRWVFLAVAVLSLGYVGFALVDAELFQKYEGWKLDRAKGTTAPMLTPPSSPVLSAAALPLAALPDKAEEGAVLGRVEIASIGVSVIVVEGTSSRALRHAVGHIAGTSMPGQTGNVGIAGHRDTFFRPLRNIQLNDEVLLTTREGSFRYRVESAAAVDADDTDVLKASSEQMLTLVTCYPFCFVGPAPQRFVVRAHRVDAHR
jgi:sortase A